MSRSEQKVILQKALTVSTQTIYAMDITNYSGLSAAVTSPAGAAGTVFLQYCGFNSSLDADWTNVPTAQYPNASVGLVAGGTVVAHASYLQVGFIRVRVTLTAGPGNFDSYILSKDI